MWAPLRSPRRRPAASRTTAWTSSPRKRPSAWRISPRWQGSTSRISSPGGICRCPVLVEHQPVSLSLLYGVLFTAEKAPDGLREQLTAELEANGPEAMYAKLQAVDPEAAAVIHPNNKVRVLRALEHYRATGKRLSEQKADSLPPGTLPQPCAGAGFPRTACQRYLPPHRPASGQKMEAGLLAGAEYVWHNREAFTPPHRPSTIKNFSVFQQTALEACTESSNGALPATAKRRLTIGSAMDGVTWLDAGARTCDRPLYA